MLQHRLGRTFVIAVAALVLALASSACSGLGKNSAQQPAASGSASAGKVVEGGQLRIGTTDGVDNTTDGCEPIRNDVNGKIALVDRGTCTFNVKVKTCQDAGAIAVIIADNVAGSPPAGLGGTDATVTIPSVRITLADGIALKTALATRSRAHSGMLANLGLNLAVRAGADPQGRMLLFAPNPFQSGSSVSHYDVSAFPNQLMEPAINGDLTHEVASLDVLSGGRLRLGVGVGWNAVEFEALGEDFTNRGKRIEEQIAVMRALWSKELVTFQGQWHRITDAGINPLPVRRSIPVWMGGESEIVLHRAARMADGWMPHFRPSADAQAIVDRLHGEIKAAGRDPSRFGIERRLALANVSSDQRVKEIAAWRAMRGITHLSVHTVGLGLASPGEHVKVLEQFKKDVLG
jgi:probable F420-dependent oxidoreductase